MLLLSAHNNTGLLFDWSRRLSPRGFSAVHRTVFRNVDCFYVSCYQVPFTDTVLPPHSVGLYILFCTVKKANKYSLIYGIFMLLYS